MKKMLQSAGYVCCLALFLIGCQKDLNKNSGLNEIPGAAASVTTQAVTCGTTRVVGLTDADLTVPHDVFALAEISNDAVNYYVKITNYVPDYHIIWAKLVYGTEAHVQSSLGAITNCQAGAPAADIFQTYPLPGVQVVEFTIPIASVGNCFFINATLRLRRTDGGSEFTIFFIEDEATGTLVCQRYIQYCKQDCPPPPPPPPGDCGQLRTQTQGGWGAPPHGNNPGRYLHNNFDAAFPGDLRVGCAGGFTLTLTTAQAITNLLPTGGTPARLTNNYTNPSSIKNVLVGQLVALTLSVGFDVYDPGFGQAGIHLGEMIIGSGPFAGKTVNEFLVIANNVLGGCSTAYSPSQINETATSINENYTDGTRDNGFLRCPPTTR